MNFPARWHHSRKYPWVAASDIVTSVSTTRGDGRVFAKLLTAFTHESTSFLDCVIEGNEGTVPFIGHTYML